MTSLLPTVKLTRFIAVLLGAVLLAVALGGGASRSDEPATVQASVTTAGAAEGTAGQSSPPVAADLFACPTLRPGMRDPINGLSCVWTLQVALRDQGYPRQRLTGFFGAQTKANVLDLQRRHGIPQTGNLGPLTRAALLGDGTATPPGPSVSPIPAASPSSYTSHLCNLAELSCSLYLRRTTTATYARALEDHKQSAAAAAFIADTLFAAACEKIFRIKIIGAACGQIASRNVTDVQNALREAGAQHACLRLTIGLPARAGTLRLVAADADNGARCKD